jgi:sec-independent protein translocase protein TatB
MFEVGITEIVLIFGIALLVLGPQRLPKLAADVGRWAGRARAMARQLRTQLEQETHFDPLADPTPVTTPAASSSTIHAPAPPVDNEARAVPAQLAADAPLPARNVASAATDELTPLPDCVPDAPAPLDKTVVDEPKHG